MFELTQQQSEDLVNIGIGKGFGISDIWSMGPSVAFILMGKDAYNRLNQLVAGNFVFNSFYANASFFKIKLCYLSLPPLRSGKIDVPNYSS